MQETLMALLFSINKSTIKIFAPQEALAAFNNKLKASPHD